MRAPLFALALSVVEALGLPGTVSAATVADLFPGARANGIGAFAALADDHQALFHNPAGLARVPVLELGVGMGRAFQPTGPLTIGTIATARPLPLAAGGVGGLGFQAMRLPGAGYRDVLLAGWSQPLEPLLGLPVLVSHMSMGVNLRVVTRDLAGKQESAFGGDAGVQWEPDKGLRLGAAATNVVTGIKDEKPVFIGGAAKDLGRLTLAADVRSREGSTVVYPGAELHLVNGILDVRFGKGVPVDGIRQAALGWGVHLDPWTLDFSMTVPWRGFGVSAGTFQSQVTFRFGGEPFETRLLSRTTQAAKRVQNEVESLRREQAQAQRSLAETEAARTVALNELRNVQFRLEEERLKLQAELHVSTTVPPAPVPAKGPLAAPLPGPLPASGARGSEWPKKHKVASGDTLRSLAERYYKDPNLWEQIYQANTDKVDRGQPRPGADLVIPAPRR